MKNAEIKPVNRATAKKWGVAWSCQWYLLHRDQLPPGSAYILEPL